MSSQQRNTRKSRAGLIASGFIVFLLVFYFILGDHPVFQSQTNHEPRVEEISDQKEDKSEDTKKEEVSRANATSATLLDFEEALIGAVEVAQDAVVSISNYQSRQSLNEHSLFGYADPFQFGDFQSDPETLELASHGSGVVYKIEGDKAYVITNNHVIAGNDALQVIMANGEVADAELIGSDDLTDLAVLSIDASFVTTTIEFADSDAIKVGSLAIAIGSPLNSNFASSVTQGIVSGLNRAVSVDVDYEANLLQTDAAINPGNSGGALVNKDGHLIGINSSKFGSDVIEGMGFAIPSNDVDRIVRQLEEKGEVVRPVLGVTAYSLDHIPTDVLEKELDFVTDHSTGALIQEVTPHSNASQGGIRAGDIIIAIDGDGISNASHLRDKLHTYQVGDVIDVEYVREGEAQVAQIELRD